MLTSFEGRTITTCERMTSFMCRSRLKLTDSAESAFKAIALAIRMAIARTGGDDVPSTKGVLAI